MLNSATLIRIGLVGLCASFDASLHASRGSRLQSNEGQWSTHQLIREDMATALFSPDGKSLAAAGANGRLIVWDVATQKIRAQSAIRLSRSPSLIFSPDGGQLASWSRSVDRTVRVWDTVTLRQTGEIRVEEGRSIASVTFIPKSDALAILSARLARPTPVHLVWQTDTAEVLMWDLLGSAALGRISAEEYKMTFSDEVAFSQDGSLMATWTGSDVQLWNVRTRSRINEPLAGHKGNVRNVTFDKSGNTLAVIDAGVMVTIWDLRTRNVRQRFTVASDQGVTFVHMPDAEVAVIGTNQGNVAIWDLVNAKSDTAPLSGHPNGRLKGTTSRDRETLAAGTSRLALVWDVPNRRTIAQCAVDGRELADDAWGIAISPDGDAVVIRRSDGRGLTLCRTN